jgi:hypothetical protein
MDYLILTFLNICALNFLFLKLSLKNSILSLISSSFYFLAIFKILKFFKTLLSIKNKIKKEDLIKKRWDKKLKFYLKTKKKRKFKKYKLFLLLIFLYILLIPQHYSKSYISYSIKYNYLHLLILLGIQLILVYIYKKFVKLQIGNYLINNIGHNLIIIGLLCNLFLLFYCIFFSINNIYVEIPVISPCCKVYRFMDKE